MRWLAIAGIVKSAVVTRFHLCISIFGQDSLSDCLYNRINGNYLQTCTLQNPRDTLLPKLMNEMARVKS